MIFFTRELFQGTQPGSGWERRALRESNRRSEIYSEYFKVIAQLLPPAVRRLCKQGLHDGIVRQAKWKDGELTLVIDTQNALSGFRPLTVRLMFRGVQRRPVISGLIGEWWLYEEAHLSSRARFSLHVMFNEIDLEIEANDLIIEVSRRSNPRTKTTAVRQVGN